MRAYISLRQLATALVLFIGYGVIAQAQVTVLSNLGQPYNWPLTIGYSNPNDFGEAFGFTTGSYYLDLTGVTFEDTSNGGVTNFTVAVYSGFSTSGPSGLVTTLSGTLNPSGGTETYSAPWVTLDPNTDYWLTFTAFGSTAATTLESTTTIATDAGALSGWSFPFTVYTTVNGGTSWSYRSVPTDLMGRFSIQAAPEPATYAVILGGLALAAAGWRRAKRRLART